MTMWRATALAAGTLLLLAGCVSITAGSPTSSPTSAPAGGDARSVVERFATALQDMDCEGLFDTTTSAARDQLGVTWVNVEECEGDREAGGDQAAASVDVIEVNEAGETSASAEVRMEGTDGTVVRLDLALLRIGSADWVISEVRTSFDGAQGPSPKTPAEEDARDEFLFLAEHFLNALADRDCYAVQVGSTKEFWAEFARSVGADDICDVVENSHTAPPVELTVIDYGIIDEGSPDKLWGGMNLTYTFEHQGALWDQPLEFGYWHEQGAPGTVGARKIYSFRATAEPVPR